MTCVGFASNKFFCIGCPAERVAVPGHDKRVIAIVPPEAPSNYCNRYTDLNYLTNGQRYHDAPPGDEREDVREQETGMAGTS